MSRQTSDHNYNLKKDIDKIDLEIINLLISGEDNNKVISSNLNIPLSTIQRRKGNIIKNKWVIPTMCLNYAKFGYHTGVIHIYAADGNIKETANKVLELDGITSVEIHIGNSDVLANFAYKDSRDLLDVIIKIKNMNGIERTLWSERLAKLDKKDNDFC